MKKVIIPSWKFWIPRIHHFLQAGMNEVLDSWHLPPAPYRYE
jgi:hypothetical protein